MHFRDEMVDAETLEADLKIEISVVIVNNWEFYEDGEVMGEMGIKFELQNDTFTFGGLDIIHFSGTYYLFGSHYTLTLTVTPSDATDIVDTIETSGTWTREGDALTLNTDSGEVLVFKKKESE